MKSLSKYRGCLLGGAAGDALGYEVEFGSEPQISRRFGESGIQDYVLHAGKALISDDTQMTLFTGNALLLGEQAGLRDAGGPWRDYIRAAYEDWLMTQEGKGPGKSAWLNNVPELNSSRAPGTTCMAYLQSGCAGSLTHPRNRSKGCGSVMRVAPIGLYFDAQNEQERLAVDLIGAESAAITHGHELAYMPAAALVHMIQLLAHDPDVTVREAFVSARGAVRQLFPKAHHLNELTDLLDQAESLADASEVKDIDAIHRLGEGWVAEEALAIAVYCALRHEEDFAAAIAAAVNHKGDSDSTGAVTGNIIGARLGMEAIPGRFLDNLEARDVIVEIADDLYAGKAGASDWDGKYVSHTYCGRSVARSTADILASSAEMPKPAE